MCCGCFPNAYFLHCAMVRMTRKSRRGAHSLAAQQRRQWSTASSAVLLHEHGSWNRGSCLSSGPPIRIVKADLHGITIQQLSALLLLTKWFWLGVRSILGHRCGNLCFSRTFSLLSFRLLSHWPSHNPSPLCKQSAEGGWDGWQSPQGKLRSVDQELELVWSVLGNGGARQMEVGKPFLLDVAAVDSWYHTHLVTGHLVRAEHMERMGHSWTEETTEETTSQRRPGCFKMLLRSKLRSSSRHARKNARSQIGSPQWRYTLVWQSTSLWLKGWILPTFGGGTLKIGIEINHSFGLNQHEPAKS